jgi:hypothetical protein
MLKSILSFTSLATESFTIFSLDTSFLRASVPTLSGSFFWFPVSIMSGFAPVSDLSWTTTAFSATS